MFGLGHHYKRIGLQVLWVRDEEEIEGDKEATSTTKKPAYIGDLPESDEETPPLSLSLSSLVGFLTPHSLKIQGQICGRDVVVLIDSRASHNFLARLKFQIYGTNDSAWGARILLDFGQFTIATQEEDHTTKACQQMLEPMAVLMGQFSNLFTSPTGLPPTREQDHAIVLK